MKRIDFFPTGDGRLELCGEGGVDNRRADLRLPPAVKLGSKGASGLTAASAWRWLGVSSGELASAER